MQNQTFKHLDSFSCDFWQLNTSHPSFYPWNLNTNPHTLEHFTSSFHSFTATSNIRTSFILSNLLKQIQTSFANTRRTLPFNYVTERDEMKRVALIQFWWLLSYNCSKRGSSTSKRGRNGRPREWRKKWERSGCWRIRCFLRSRSGIRRIWTRLLNSRCGIKWKRCSIPYRSSIKSARVWSTTECGLSKRMIPTLPTCEAQVFWDHAVFLISLERRLKVILILLKNNAVYSALKES